MSRLSAGVMPLLDQSTRELLRVAGDPLVKKHGRSFVIIGIYAITLDSIGPVSSAKRLNLVSIK